MEVKRYGWKPDIPDHRDRRLQLAPHETTGLPRQYSLRNWMPPVTRQKRIGSCTAHAVAGLLGYRERTDTNQARCLVPSPLYIYYNTRRLEDTTAFDSGASIRDAVKSLVEYGICEEGLWPYDEDQFTVRPSAAAYAQAKQYKLVEYSRVGQSLADLKGCLFRGDPVAFGFTVYDAFENAATASSGLVNLPGPGEKPRGGHAVLLVGYDDATGRFEVRNSYGSAWGDRGYFTIPYLYVLNPDLADDLWTFGVMP
jgi:C1A family cysteine protease